MMSGPVDLQAHSTLHVLLGSSDIRIKNGWFLSVGKLTQASPQLQKVKKRDLRLSLKGPHSQVMLGPCPSFPQVLGSIVFWNPVS